MIIEAKPQARAGKLETQEDGGVGPVQGRRGLGSQLQQSGRVPSYSGFSFYDGPRLIG